ncbi:amino acid adenylation domain-containing protein [Rhizobium sp. 1AS11]|uniref:non-ribosomal peptide synthetase n=1 Tax=Rhizobium acaciae TaxID=2989736 RepID=UPI00222174E8|nr:non-ribosomal peptide synthetase [Rhizobium acaciae]MCW1413753.1 amino acid adenylation domain-containing protein [Rhizobium acaciae]MCW1746261.1 amino acid adenylation domain-containing protein [Rhizobium acaciae]
MLNEVGTAKSESVISQLIDVVASIDEIAASFPDRIAIKHGAEELTYGELRLLSDKIASTLREHSAEGRIVGYFGDRNPHWAATVIAILKSGSTYLPLDPSLPTSRISFMIEQSGCTLIIGPERPEELGLFQENSKGRRQFLTVQTALHGGPASPGMPALAEGHLAYILFTSGSTGRPKGVMVKRAGLNNHLRAKMDALELSEKDCVAQTASHSFDISLWQLLAGLCVGSCVAIIDDSTVRSPTALLRALQANRVTIAQFVPSVLAVFVEYLQSLSVTERFLRALRMVSTVGEPLTPALAHGWLTLFPRVPILNHYGPTECADGVTHHFISLPPSTAETYLPIGKPIANLRVYVVNGSRLCKTGEVGEICVSGVGVADGYINDGVRSKDVFLSNPFSDHPSYRQLYKTGDLGRIRADGLLECLGRRDRQIKIRGHRIELGEIESRLCAHPLVSAAVAVTPVNESVKLTAREITHTGRETGPRRILAYVSAPAELSEGELRSFAAETLPAYMLPERLIRVDRMPITRNGKVDLALLPDPTTVRPELQSPLEQPKTELESTLRDIWSSVLRIEGIGVNDQFMDLGGDSLRAVLILARIQRQLGANADFRIVLNGTIRSLALSISNQSETTKNVLPPCGKLRRAPLTRVQEHLWFLWQLYPTTKNYIIQGGMRIRGAVDQIAFNKAWNDVVQAHDALSARFIDEDGPVQIFDDPQRSEIELVDATHLPQEEAEELLAELRRKELNNPFDLSQGHLFRARLIRLGADDHLMLITAHEIIIDAWSISVLLRDLQTRYSNPAAVPPPDRPSLSTYALWESVHLTPKSLSDQRHYWRRQLGDNPPVLSLGNRLRSKVSSYRGNSHAILLSGEVSDQVRDFARRHRCTTSTILLACFKLLLRMYSGQDDVIVGIPHVVRSQPGTEEIVGFFLNMLPIRTTIDVNKSFAAHVNHVHNLTSDAIANSAYPFSWMVRDTRFHREPGRSPIFQVMFNMYSEPAEPPAKRDLELTFREYDTGYVKFDLTLYAQDEGDAIALQLAYAEDVFSSDAIARMADNLRHLLATCVERSAEPIVTLSSLSPSEVTILNSLKGDERSYEDEPSLVEAFDQVSASNIDRVAYFGEFGAITFGHLRERMAAIQSVLRTCGVGPGDIVAMLVDRSPDVAATTLAIRDLQATVVPISPDYPEERVGHIVRDSGASLLVRAREDKEVHFGVPCVSLSTLQAGHAPGRVTHRTIELPDKGAASLIYTSSSTGKAKGVVIPESAMLNRLNWMWRCFPFDRFDVMAVQKSAGLVAAAWEYFGGLLKGVPTLILTQEQLHDPDLLLSELARNHVTWLSASPPILSGLIAAQKRLQKLTNLRLVTSSAEPMPASLPSRWRECFPDVPLWNFYGNTECASNAAVYGTTDADDGSSAVPVGRPIDNVRMYVLDAQLKRVPVGVAGELCVAGRCVSAGYWKDPERTKHCFVPNPYDEGQYSVLYRSGDIARISAKGLLEICGRADNQIQLRGFRIELEEIETALGSHPAIAQAAVFVEGKDDDRRLVALVAPDDDSLTSGDIVSHLRQTLPSYMIPSDVQMVRLMPLTANGKIDRARLPFVSSRAMQKTEPAEPRTERERLLAGIWQELLGAKSIGIDDSFFDIGGNSLLSVRCVTLARKAGLSLTVNQLHQTPTIRELATYQTSAATSALAASDGPMPVTPAISHWNSCVGIGEHYNIVDLFFMPAGILNVFILERALAHVIGREEALRLRIAETESGLSQVIGSIPDPIVEEINLVGMATAQQLTAIEQACAERQRIFRFDGRTPLIRVSAFRTSESGDYYLLVLLHHFVADGVGYRLFLNALEAAYDSFAAGRTAADPDTTTLSRWLQRLGNYANGEAVTELEHWEGLRYDLFDIGVSDSGTNAAGFSAQTARWLHYAGSEKHIDEEFCRPLWKDQATYHIRISEETTGKLLKVAAASAQCEDFDLLLAAISGAFGRAFGNYSLWIDSLTSTRGCLFDDIDPSQIIGYIGELVPLPLYVTGTESRPDRARSIYQQRTSLPRQGIGFRALKFLNRHPAVRERIDRLPLPRIGVNYRARLQRHYPRRLLSRDPHPLWIGEDMDQSVMNYLFWFRVGYQSGELHIEVRYDPRQVGYETTRNLCTILRDELLQTVDAFREFDQTGNNG